MRSAVALGSFAIAVALMTACGDDTSNAGGAGGGGGVSADGGAGAAGGAAAGGAEEGGAGGAGECLAFGTTCEIGIDTCCDAAGATGECYVFGMGPKCTIPCPADPADCPNNGEGCNNMDPPVCKDP